MSITKRRTAIALSAVLVLAVILSLFSMTSVADETARSDYSVKFAEGGFIHADAFSGYSKVFIIDVSSHQASVDWNKVYASGIDGVMLRVGYTGYRYGTYNSDTSFGTFYDGAKAAGLKVGAYYYGQPTSVSDAEYEASYALGLISGRSFDLPVAYDLEYATNDSGLTGRLYESNFSSYSLTNVANAFCNKIQSAGYEAMVYVNCSLLTQNMMQAYLNYSVWIARYNSYVDYSCTYKMWQFSKTSSVDGVSGNCDVSVMYLPASSSSSEEQTTAPSGQTSEDQTLYVPATDVTVNTETTETTAASTDYFTMILDFMLKLLEYAAQYIPKLLAMFTSIAAA